MRRDRPVKISVGRDIEGYEIVTYVDRGKIVMLHERGGAFELVPVAQRQQVEHKPTLRVVHSVDVRSKPTPRRQAILAAVL
jgi:hypothetical protein